MAQADMHPIAAAKVELRKRLIQQRRSLDVEIFQAKSQAICNRLQQSAVFQNARTVLAYFGIRQEPDLTPLWTSPSNPVQWGFPRCEGTDLLFHGCNPSDPTQFQTGAYGIQEPQSRLPRIELDRVDLVLVPAVACDRAGYRLGYGGGYYDRLFAKQEWAKIPAIAIVFDFALLDQLPQEPWDCSLAGVCTEQALLLF
jgi:5-formyltetrahydrofolate cyclo-ligase